MLTGSLKIALAEHRNAPDKRYVPRRCGTREEAAAKQLTRTGRHIYREVTAVQTPCSLAFDYNSSVVLSPPPSGGGRGRGQCPVCLSRVHVYTYVRIRWCPIKCLRRLAFRQRRATNVVERVSNPFGVPRHNAELLQVQCACVNELSRGKRAAGIEIGPYAGQRSSTRGVREPPTRTIAFCSGKFQSFEVHKRTEEASFHKPSSSRLIVEFYSHRQFYARTSSFTFCSS